MNRAGVEEVAPGFEQLPTGLGFTDVLQPCYRKVEQGSASFGLVVKEHHCNSMGRCHGGTLMTLADITAASGVNLAQGKLAGSPTLNLSMDFIGSAKLGQWLQAVVQQVEVKRRFGFCSGSIFHGDRLIARFNATCYLPDHDGMWEQWKDRRSVLTDAPD